VVVQSVGIDSVGERSTILTSDGHLVGPALHPKNCRPHYGYSLGQAQIFMNNSVELTEYGRKE
jgi:hypothetical protein